MALKELFVNPTCRYIVIAGCARYWAGFAIGFYMPSFFGGIYPTYYATYYAPLNAAVVSLCGFTSAIMGGIISDKYEKRGYFMTKAWVCTIGSGLGIPTIMLCTLVTSNFWISLLGLALEYLVAECWIGPAITMILNSISPENKGLAVGAFLFFCSMFGMFSTLTLGKLGKAYNVTENPDTAGVLMCIYVSAGYGLSLPFFLLAGRNYTKVKLLEVR